MDEQKALVPQSEAAALVRPETVSADQTGLLEARIRADAQVRATLALARPRDLLRVRERILADARRPAFAAQAEYAVPRAGTTIRGPSIRFAESVIRALGNVTVEVAVVAEDEERRLVEVTVCDLEANALYRQGFVVRKVVERRKLPPNQRPEDVLGTRTGADGQTIYLIRASEADLAMMQASQASRVIRNLGLRLAPGDLVEEALRECARTREGEAKADPQAAIRRIADAFAELRVSVQDLQDYLGHPLVQASPAEIETLRGVWTAIKEGTTTWAQVVAEARPAVQAEQPAATQSQPEAPSAGVPEQVKERMRKVRSDKGVPRGPRVPKAETEVIEVTPETSPIAPIPAPAPVQAPVPAPAPAAALPPTQDRIIAGPGPRALELSRICAELGVSSSFAEQVIRGMFGTMTTEGLESMNLSRYVDLKHAIRRAARERMEGSEESIEEII